MQLLSKHPTVHAKALWPSLIEETLALATCICWNLCLQTEENEQVQQIPALAWSQFAAMGSKNARGFPAAATQHNSALGKIAKWPPAL